jgi:alcohol dehydrogenase class IV
MVNWRGIEGEWRYRSSISDHSIWGPNAHQSLRAQLEERKLERVVLLFSRSLWENTSWGKEISDMLKGLVVYESHNSHEFAPDWLCFDTANAVRNLEPDVVITIGGGSVIDWGKAVRFILAQGLTSVDELDDYVASPENQQLESLPKIPISQIAVPTTLSGATTWSVTINRPEKKFKDHVRHPSLMQELVIYDGAMSCTTPTALWSATGLKAVEHVVERMYSLVGNPVGDALAERAGTLLFEGLPLVKQLPDDPKSRVICQMGLMTIEATGRGVQKGLCQVIGWQLGAYGVAHGHTACVMLPHVMRFNLPETIQPQATLGRALGCPSNSDESAAEYAITSIEKLTSELDLPKRLRDVDIKSEDLATIAEKVSRSPNIIYNPIPVRDPEIILEVLQKAW